jgi:3-hydroxyacyl-[acyl-carrier-protein] dehydratase
VDRARFRRPVVPGDQLRMDFEYTRIKPSMVKGRGTARVGSDVCAEAEIFSVGVEG